MSKQAMRLSLNRSIISTSLIVGNFVERCNNIEDNVFSILITVENAIDQQMQLICYCIKNAICINSLTQSKIIDILMTISNSLVFVL